jgi:hypothetical protein
VPNNFYLPLICSSINCLQMLQWRIDSKSMDGLRGGFKRHSVQKLVNNLPCATRVEMWAHSFYLLIGRVIIAAFIWAGGFDITISSLPCLLVLDGRVLSEVCLCIMSIGKAIGYT